MILVWEIQTVKTKIQSKYQTKTKRQIRTYDIWRYTYWHSNLSQFSLKIKIFN